MRLLDRATILHYHRHRIATFGEGTTGALGWRDEESQTRRFEAIAAAADFNGAALLDLGCGHGDLCGFLYERFADFSYLGLEQVPEFVARAKETYLNHPRTSFHQCDFSTVQLPRVDYVIASGALNYRCEDADYFVTTVKRMYEAAGKALIFNVLDTEQFPEHPLLMGRDLEAVAAICRELSPSVRVVTGYAVDDTTFCVDRT